MRFQLPDSTLLKFLMGWMVTASVMKLMYCYQAHTLSTERAILLYLLGLVLIYLFGAFWSEFPVLYVPAMLCAVAFILALLVRGPTARSTAKYSFLTIMYLSLITIWVEPWLTAAGLATFVVLALLRVTTSAVDIGVSIGWLVLWPWTWDEINRNV